MATYSQATITLTQTPSKFSPVYAPNWFTFTGNLTNTAATDPYLITDVYILNQFGNISGTDVFDYAGRFKVPMRGDATFVFNPEQILKSYVTYPYNNRLPNGSVAAYPDRYVNEMSGFGSPTSSFPTLSPEADGIVNYRMRYGIQYNPNFTFYGVQSTTGSTTKLVGSASNTFGVAGDIINISMDSGLYSYYNGTASILTLSVSGGTTSVTIDKAFNTTLGAISLTASGIIQSVQHMAGTSSTFYAYNGTRQWNEQDINFDNIYLLREKSASGGGYTSSLAPYTSTASNIQFMNDWGRTASQAIPIKPGQNERIRFIADLTFATGAYSQLTQRLYDMRIDTYDTGMNLVSTVYNSLNDAPGGPLYPNKCFTLQVFDGNQTIVDGYKYKITVRGYSHLFTIIDYASIWYVGEDKCSQYDNYRIKFLNRQGTWCYWNFNKDNKQTTNIRRTEYKQPYQYDYSLKYPSDPTAITTTGYTLAKLRGQNTLSIAATETFTLNSDWITEEQYTYLQQLLTSPQVFIFYDRYTMIDGSQQEGVNIPIIITDNSYTFKTRQRDRIFNMVLNYKYAYDTSIQNP